MVCSVVAVIFILSGFILKKFPPKKINGFIGYRSTLSMKNQETWDAAQQYGGFTMILFGIIHAVLGVWSFLQPMNVNNETAQLLFLLIGTVLMIVIDEVHLGKLFNKDGTRKDGL
jgi:uncharacterized membrane protein